MYKNTLIITEDKQSPLRKIAMKNNCTILNHEKDIGGRYSIFSNVGLLPALINNFDAKKFLLGANSILSGVSNEMYLEHKKLSKIFYNHDQTNFINSVLMTLF
jgi:Glucose-6-phosphate isomerase